MTIACLCSVCVCLLPSQGDRQVEDRQHHGAAVISEQVSYDGGRDGGVAGLTDAHQSPGEHEQPVVLQRENMQRRTHQQGLGVLLAASNPTFITSEKSPPPQLIWKIKLIDNQTSRRYYV